MVKSLAHSLAYKMQSRITAGILEAKDKYRHYADLDIVLSSALQKVGNQEGHFPLEYIKF